MKVSLVAVTLQGLPSTPNTVSPTDSAPIVDHPAGVATGVSRASALPFFLGISRWAVRKRLSPVSFDVHPNTAVWMKTCQGWSSILPPVFAHSPLMCGSFSRKRQTRAAFLSSKRYGKPLRPRSSSCLWQAFLAHALAGSFPEATPSA